MYSLICVPQPCKKQVVYADLGPPKCDGDTLYVGYLVERLWSSIFAARANPPVRVLPRAGRETGRSGFLACNSVWLAWQ